MSLNWSRDVQQEGGTGPSTQFVKIIHLPFTSIATSDKDFRLFISLDESKEGKTCGNPPWRVPWTWHAPATVHVHFTVALTSWHLWELQSPQARQCEMLTVFWREWLCWASHTNRHGYLISLEPTSLLTPSHVRKVEEQWTLLSPHWSVSTHRKKTSGFWAALGCNKGKQVNGEFSTSESQNRTERHAWPCAQELWTGMHFTWSLY